MPTVHTTTSYKFDELSEDAQQVAIEKLRDINTSFGDWWECTYDDAKNVSLKLKSFDVYQGTIDGEFFNFPIDTARQIIADHGMECETYKLATTYLMHYLANMSRHESESVDAPDGENDEFYDELGMELGEEFRSDLLEAYLSSLKSEYDYMGTDEAVAETLSCNDYDFLENGDQYN